VILRHSFFGVVGIDEQRLRLSDPWVRRIRSAIQESSAEALLLQLSSIYTLPVCGYLRFL